MPSPRLESRLNWVMSQGELSRGAQTATEKVQAPLSTGLIYPELNYYSRTGRINGFPSAMRHPLFTPESVTGTTIEIAYGEVYRPIDQAAAEFVDSLPNSTQKEAAQLMLRATLELTELAAGLPVRLHYRPVTGRSGLSYVSSLKHFPIQHPEGKE